MKFETLIQGYGLIEGPRVDSEDNLYFSDVTNGGVYRRSPAGEVSTIVPKRRGVGGIALHADGGIVISGRDICHCLDGETRILYRNPDILGYNDLCTDAAGRVYFGSLRSSPFTNDGPRIPGELYRLGLDGEVERLYGDIELTNGIGFSPTGHRLYHCDTAKGHIVCHEIVGDHVGRRSVFATVTIGRPDGLAVDEEGGVWIASYSGGCVLRYHENGSLDAEIEVPARSVTSLCFGGRDRRDLYVVSADSVGTGSPEDGDGGGAIFRARTEVAGLAVALARV